MSGPECTQEGCEVASSGKCLEGFEPIEKCPYLSTEEASQRGLGEPIAPTNFIDLSTGEALSTDEAAEVTRNGPTRVVILAGPHQSGKTTILTSLFDSFQEAPFANYLFAGSKTLVGFERRCFDARRGRTHHTSIREGIRFLHLELAPARGNLGSRQHLLMSDISGEIFRQLRDSGDAARNMTVLARADHLCLVIDGQRLVDAEERQIARNDPRLILRSIMESGNLNPACHVDVVFSKWDVIVAAKSDEALAQFLIDTRDVLVRTVGDSARMTFHEIAARPEKRALPFAHGLPTLLRSWMAEAPLPRLPKLYLSGVDRVGRQFAQFPSNIVDQHHLKELFDVRWI